MKVCIIGAGSSGIAACKVFQDNNIDFDCFEKGSDIGGLWWYENDNGQNSIYKSLCINTSKDMMAYSDYPMPKAYPDYPSHTQIFDYFNNYIHHFGFRPKIHFNTTVTQVDKKCDKYLVTTNKHTLKEYDAVIVCNGHHWNPKYASFSGNFNGEVIHAHDYKTPERFKDKKILVIGIGNSGVDLSSELSSAARKVVVSTRSGAYIIPKYLFGVPTDHISRPPLAYAPLGLQRFALNAALRLNIGRQEKYGVPLPNRPILAEHPTISQVFLKHVKNGKIHIKPNITNLKQHSVEFEDGTEETFDCIIHCTGYNMTFPFLDESIFCAKDNHVELYHKVVDPNNKNLFFIGLIQPLGAIMPLSEAQAKWVASILNGKSILPDKATMLKSIQKDKHNLKIRYKESPRHTIQVDFFPYKRLLERATSRY